MPRRAISLSIAIVDTDRAVADQALSRLSIADQPNHCSPVFVTVSGDIADGKNAN